MMWDRRLITHGEGRRVFIGRQDLGGSKKVDLGGEV